jgi:hypothetical protein
LEFPLGLFQDRLDCFIGTGLRGSDPGRDVTCREKPKDDIKPRPVVKTTTTKKPKKHCHMKTSF